jgi:hypothetical protein
VAAIGRISVKFNIGDFCGNLSRKSKFGYNRAKISGTLLEDLSKSRVKLSQAVRMAEEV